MINAGKPGRPKRGTISLDDVIIRHLLLRGAATWGELKDAMPEGSTRNDSSLKKAIDRLHEGLIIMPAATLRDGKAITVYKLVRPEVSYNFYKENIPLYRWIDETYTELASSTSPSSRNHSSIKLEDKNIDMQGNALAIALQGLSLEILDAIQTSYAVNEGSEAKRRAYFETAWETYLSVIAMDISLLASPDCGNTTESIRIAKKKLNSIDGRKRKKEST